MFKVRLLHGRVLLIFFNSTFIFEVRLLLGKVLLILFSFFSFLKFSLKLDYCLVRFC
jgi:hypothetical protein